MPGLIICSVFYASLLMPENIKAQSLALEAGEKNLNIIYRLAAIYDATSPVILDTRLLYSKQNHHQDLFAAAGMTAYSGKDLKLGAGFKIIAADPLDYSLTAMTIGGELIFNPRRSNLKIETSLYYAGQSLTFSDGASVSLFTVNMDYAISHRHFIRLGYRRIKTEIINEINDDFDDGAYLGLVSFFN